MSFEALMSDVSTRLASLSQEERAALVMRLKRKTQRTENTVADVITRRDNGTDAPLSFAQQRLWFLYQLDPGNAAYHVPLYHYLLGQLDITAFERSLNEIVLRHEVLRTVFKEKNGATVQIVLPSLRVELPVIDLSGFSESETEREVERLIEAESAQPFSLEDGPLLRAKLLKISEDKHGLLLVIHHIVTDGWSMNIFMSELVALYEAFSTGGPSPLQELSLQYRDFATWQRESITGERLEKQIAYWKDQLSGDLPVLELPTDRPRPSHMTYSGADEWFDVTQSLTEKLNELSHREGATLFMTLLAAWLTLLHRYTGQRDILLGTAIAGRNRREIENLIGFFINTAVLRTDLSSNPTFRELLARVREVALGAYEHQDVPFEKLVEELQPERDISRPPFFQVMFNLQAAAPEEPVKRSLTIATQDIGNQTRFDLEFHLWVVPEGLAGPLLYNTDLFERATIERMLTHFQTLLEGIAGNPDARLSELPLLTKQERMQVQQWSTSESEYAREQCVQQLVEVQAVRHPDAPAVVYREQRLSYGELNQRANQLAHYLRGRGVGLETRVGVLLEPSVTFIVALLGILKAGGAYVPLDLEYPTSRLQFMLDDAGVELALTVRGQTELGEGREIVYLDDDGWKLLGKESSEDLDVVTSAENLAYVMYTSGSTGQPKGVGVTHRAINRLVRHTNYVQLDHNDRIAQVSNVSFDAATFEIWGALANGGTLVGLPKETVLSPLELKREISEQQVSAIFLTTALFNQVAQGAPDAFAPMRYVLFGGEASDAQSVRRVLEHGKPEHLLHVYGPTEGTTYTTWYEVNEVAAGARTLPIGRALSNSEVWVLDHQGQMAPVGVMGELYIGGDGLAREYLGRPELTAEKLVPHPYSVVPGARLYRTGDLVRYLCDGNLDFLKRIDQQVKIRGFRIEPAEIEAVLQEYPAVRESLVVTREDTPGDKRLVAYVVPEAEVTPESQLVTELRSWLRARLPEYFMPALFVVLHKLPLTPNGKIDRRALPAPEYIPQLAEETLILPRTPEEERVAEIWADVLDIKPIGMEANFFDLGGHSLLATRIITRIREACSVNVPLRVMFDSPTIAAVAAQVAKAREQSDVGRIAEMVERLTHLSEDETRSLLQKTAGSQEF
jgi:amino acid adenylation domain-containing protein